MVLTYLIYLSGPIAGLTFRESTEWRNQVAEELEGRYDLEILDPMRDVEAEPDTVIDAILADAHSVTSIDPAMLTDQGIVMRDHHDTCRSNLLLVNMLGAKKASIGTVAELAWAYDRQIPTILIMEPSGKNPHEHPFVRVFTDYRVDTIERSLNVLKSVLALQEPVMW